MNWWKRLLRAICFSGVTFALLSLGALVIVGDDVDVGTRISIYGFGLVVSIVLVLFFAYGQVLPVPRRHQDLNTTSGNAATNIVLSSAFYLFFQVSLSERIWLASWAAFTLLAVVVCRFALSSRYPNYD